MATIEARRPTMSPFASITTHFLSTSAGFSEVVFIALDPRVRGAERPFPKRSAAAEAAAAMGGHIGASGRGVKQNELPLRARNHCSAST